MTVITLVLMILCAVTVSAMAAKVLPAKLPLPLIQIAVGIAVSYTARVNVILDPHVFFLLFIPPLLFLDGWRIPKSAFFSDLGHILTLSLGLVAFTVVGVGLLISSLLPSVPLPIAFAVAAILSPTDPVAVSAVLSGSSIPPRLSHILEGEALLNDASGLVCFRFAVAAQMTGQFSLVAASWNFVVVALGGVLAGLIVTAVVGYANRRLSRQSGEDAGIEILISLLIPFLAYSLAEELQVSGVLAAAAAGIAMHYVDFNERKAASTRLQRNSFWNAVQMMLNGAIFVILGAQIPGIALGSMGQLNTATSLSLWHLLGCILAIVASMTLLRFVWVWMTLKLLSVVRRRQQEVSLLPKRNRILWITAFAGVRGAITLAGMLSLPLVLLDGRDFPFRDGAIVLAMGVIIVSLLTASAALPMLARGLELPAPASNDEAMAMARRSTADAALRRIAQMQEKAGQRVPRVEFDSEATTWVVNRYKMRLADPHTEPAAAPTYHAAKTSKVLGLEALHAERETLYAMRRKRAIDDEVFDKLTFEIDLIESALINDS